MPLGCIVLVWVLAWAVPMGVIAYVAYHFITKFW